MVDPYERKGHGGREIIDPAQKAFAIEPDDNNDLAESTRALWVGGAGDISVIMVGDTAAVTFAGAQAGSLIPLRVKRVRSTSTTATSIVGVY